MKMMLNPNRLFFGKHPGPAKILGVTLLVLHHHVISVLRLLRSLFKVPKNIAEVKRIRCTSWRDL